MTSITALIQNKRKMCHWMGYSYCYIAVDLHGTIFHASKKNKNNIQYYQFAKQALQKLSKHKDIKLILFTSTYKEDIQRYLDKLTSDNIKIDYVMENPEVESNDYADFSQKFYFDVLIDDKAGFDEEDWEEIVEYL